MTKTIATAILGASGYTGVERYNIVTGNIIAFINLLLIRDIGWLC